MQVCVILWASCRGTPSSQAAVWKLAATLSHQAGSSRSWSALTQATLTCISCSAPCLLPAGICSALVVKLIHTLTHFRYDCTHRGRAETWVSYSTIQQMLLFQYCGHCSDAGQLNASGEAGGGRGATKCKVSVNETDRLDGHTEAVEVRPNLHKSSVIYYLLLLLI